jgi:hypothetical protein
MSALMPAQYHCRYQKHCGMTPHHTTTTTTSPSHTPSHTPNPNLHHPITHPAADHDHHMDIAKTFVPPGRVLYLHRQKELVQTRSRLSGSRPMERVRYRPGWCSAAAVVDDGLVVAGSMFVDHFPDTQLDVLQQAADEARSGLKGVKQV